MPSNPNIALSFKQPQFRSPLDTYSRAQQIVANSMAVDKAQNEANSLNALRGYVKSGGTLDTPEAMAAAIKAGANPDVVRGLASQGFEFTKEAAGKKTDLEKELFNRLSTVDEAQDDQAWVNWLANWSNTSAEHKADADELMRMTGGKFNRNIVRALMAGSEAHYNKNVPAARADVVYGPNGEVMEARIGGQKPGGVFQLEQFNLEPPRTGTVTVEDMPEPDNAPVMTAEAERFIASFPSEAQPAIRERVMRGDLGNIPMGNPAPAAGTRGGRGAPYEAIDQMPMRASSPQSGMVSNLGPEEGYVGTGRGAVGRNPMQAPAPGIYNVPTSTVVETSRATRPSKDEVFETELAKINAARAAGPAPLTPQQKLARRTEVANAYTKTQTLMDKAYNPKEGIVALASKIKALSDDQKEAITGWSGYIPSYRETSKEADTLVGNLKGVVTALGKDAAAATGAIGPMAVQEWQIASDMIAKLNLEGMTPRALDAQMDRIINQVSRATNLAQRVYDVQYGDDIKQYPAFRLKGGSPPKAKTPVPKGGSMISPDIEKILKSRGL